MPQQYFYNFVFIPPLLVVVAVLVRYVWNKSIVAVNCWFCSKDSRVARESRNSWKCHNCEQYNGFDESGGYNREIPEQHDFRLNTNRVFAFAQKLIKAEKPDLTNLQSPNGLCKKCNDQEALKTRLLAGFTPSSEETFDQEIELYRRRLEKSYALCFQCRRFVQNELKNKNEKFAPKDFLNSTVARRIRRSAAASAYPSTTLGASFAERIVKKRARRAKLSNACRFLHWTNILISMLLTLASLYNLQRNSDAETIELGDYMPLHLLFLLSCVSSVFAAVLTLAGLLAHCVAMKIMKARIILTDLLVSSTWLALFYSHVSKFVFPSENTHSQRADSSVYETGFACITCALSVWTAVLPRKPLRKTVARKFGGCFSVASTPESQLTCLSRMTTAGEANLSDSNFSPSPSVDLCQRDNAQFAEPSADVTSEVEEQWMAKERRARSGRESATPSRELGGILTQLSLGREGKRGPFEGRQTTGEARKRTGSSSPFSVRFSMTKRGISLGPFSSLTACRSADPSSLWSAGRANAAAGSVLTPSRLQAVGSTTGLFGSPAPTSFSHLSEWKFPNSPTVDYAYTRVGHPPPPPSLCASSMMTSASQIRQQQPVSPVEGEANIKQKSDLLWKLGVGFVLFSSLATNIYVLYYLTSK